MRPTRLLRACPSTAHAAVTIPSNDPLYRLKRDKLAAEGLSTQQVRRSGGGRRGCQVQMRQRLGAGSGFPVHVARQPAGPNSPSRRPLALPRRLQTFQLSAATPLPEQLLPYLRVVHATREADVEGVRFGEGAAPVAPENELTVLNQVRDARALSRMPALGPHANAGQACSARSGRPVCSQPWVHAGGQKGRLIRLWRDHHWRGELSAVSVQDPYVPPHWLPFERRVRPVWAPAPPAADHRATAALVSVPHYNRGGRGHHRRSSVRAAPDRGRPPAQGGEADPAGKLGDPFGEEKGRAGQGAVAETPGLVPDYTCLLNSVGSSLL